MSETVHTGENDGEKEFSVTNVNMPSLGNEGNAGLRKGTDHGKMVSSE